jgi:hypothetical protein
LLDACRLLNEPPRATAKLTWDNVREIRAKAKAGVQQSELATAFRISRPLCNEIVHGHIWNPDSKLTVGDEMRDRIIGALDTACRRGEMMKICTGTISDTRRCRGWRTRAYPFTSCSCSRGTPASRRRSAI